MEITEQEQDSLLEMTMALSKFLNSHELDDILRVYLGLIDRLKDEGNNE
jgi:hypothetical protein